MYFTLTRSRIVAIGAAAVLAVLIGGRFSAARPEQNGATHALRMTYVSSLGCSVDENAGTVKTVTIPQTFSAVYENYNALQKQAGFDLTAYRGCQAELYSYPVLSDGKTADEKMLHLLVCDGEIIGGDIASVALDGTMLPLCRQRE